jgi:hypothetical protein
MLAAMLCCGCASPYHADRGAVFGGLLGAGTGALVGSAVGNPGAGAAIGAGVGALSGAAVGSGMDDIEARNRAEIAQRLGRPVAAGAVSTDEVITMTRAGVDEQLISNHVRAHGMATPLTSNDLIRLQQQGVSPNVIATMQQPPPAPAMAGPVYAGPAPVYMAPAPVYVEPCWPRPYYYHPRRHHHPGVSWGFSVSH